MIGFETQLNTVEQLVDSLDVEKQDLRMIRLYDIQHVGAEEVKSQTGGAGNCRRGASATPLPDGATNAITQATTARRRPQPGAAAPAGREAGRLLLLPNSR